MKTFKTLTGTGWGFLCVAGWFLGASVLRALVPINEPQIAQIRVELTNVVVVVQVPAGLTKITLESRTRLEAGAWIPRLVTRLDGRGGWVTNTLPKSEQVEVLRIRADDHEALPAFCYAGTNSFVGSPSSQTSAINTPGGIGPVDTTTPGATTDTRAVVESDIWQIRGNTLYFFNQYRGLQVIDLSNPDAPVIKGTLSLPASGEQMYVLDDNHVILLTYSGANWTFSNNSEYQVLIVNVTNGTPSIIASLPIAGYIQDSRLVGTALYVAASAYRPVADQKYSTMEYGSLVAAFDLAQPAQPVVKNTFWYPGYGNVVSATDQFLFVAMHDSNNWYQSVIHCLDISNPDGTMIEAGIVTPRGTIGDQTTDKYKMNLSDHVFSVVSEVWQNLPAAANPTTWLETFTLTETTDGTRFTRLGELKLKEGERLFGTRFDGNKAYVVTFLRIDPLFIVDLSNPAKPAIISQLTVPGWSTYLQPLGDRLVTIGYDNTSNQWRTAVSLFDVHDPAHPALLSRVPLGEGSSWSEATYDERAFCVLPDAGLILVPYQGWSTNGYAQQVQLIDLHLDDLTSQALVARGAINHTLQPRRATLFRDHVLSLSGWELLSVDATDRDHPAVRSTTELAWNVSRVLLAGKYLIEIDDGSQSGWWGYPSRSNATLRCTLAQDPNAVVGMIRLSEPLAIVGATAKNNRLFVLQGDAPLYYPMMYLDKTADASGTDTNPIYSLLLSSFDLTRLPEFHLAGQIKLESTNAPASAMQALWLKTNLIVWAGGNSYSYWNWYAPMEGVRAASVTAMPYWYPWRTGASQKFVAFDVSDLTQPRLVSALNLGNNNWYGFTSAFLMENLIYTGHSATEFVEGIKPPYPQSPIVKYDPDTGQYTTNEAPVGVWLDRYYLDVIDYSDPQTPTVRKPVNIPGNLQGLSHQGAVVYTLGQHWSTNWTSDYKQWLEASAYDGVSAVLVDSLPILNWPNPIQISDNHVFVGLADYSTNQLHRIETWSLNDIGRFVRLGAWPQTSPAYYLATFGNLLAAQNSDRSIWLFNATNPAKLVPVGQGYPTGWTWGTLNQADGSLTQGLWMPLNDYGVLKVNLN